MEIENIVTYQVLPRKFTDARTYNMLVSVCVKAKDLTQALHAADMLKSTGRKLDTILYTNLISGEPALCGTLSVQADFLTVNAACMGAQYVIVVCSVRRCGECRCSLRAVCSHESRGCEDRGSGDISDPQYTLLCDAL